MGSDMLAQVQVYHYGNGPRVQFYLPRSKFTTLEVTHGLRFIGPSPCIPLWKWPMGSILLAQVQVYHYGSDPWAEIYWPRSKFTTVEMARGHNFIVPGPSLPLWK